MRRRRSMPWLSMALFALSSTQACRCSQEPELLSPEQVCDEVGFALSSRAVACGATVEEGNEVFAQFSSTFSCDAASETAKLLDCVASLLLGACEVAPKPGAPLELALGASPVCTEVVQHKDGGVIHPPCEDPNQTRCGDVCVSLQSSSQHCGACDNRCSFNQDLHQIGYCHEGVCQPQCISPYQDCDGDLSNGCELDILASHGDPLHCGGCGIACSPPDAPGLEAQCLNRICAYVCDAQHLDCDGDLSNGCEIEVDAENCYACGQDCSFQGVVVGTCNFELRGCQVLESCEQGLYNCSELPGCETPLSEDNCGGCGWVCPSYPNTTRSCELPGYCDSQCISGFLDCNQVLEDGCEIEAEHCP